MSILYVAFCVKDSVSYELISLKIWRYLKYRVFHAKCNIKNRHIFVSGRDKKIPKTVLESSWIAIFLWGKMKIVILFLLYAIDMVLGMVIVKTSYFSKARFGTFSLLFLITSKRVELESWDWSCFKDRFKWIIDQYTVN